MAQTRPKPAIFSISTTPSKYLNTYVPLSRIYLIPNLGTMPIFYALISILHLIGEAFNLSLVYFTKPLLIPALAFWWWQHSRSSPIRNTVLWALVFSTLGDILLMGAGRNAYFFLLGLAAFLVAHVFYIYTFRTLLRGKKGYLQQYPAWILPFFLYLVGLLYFLWGGIPMAMKGAVAVYAATITIMAILALHLRGVISDYSARWLFLGAVLFVLSDSMIAINKFGYPFPEARVAIMGTYILGQYALVWALSRWNSN
jgi:uncharacterized membrane protein YhhN